MMEPESPTPDLTTLKIHFKCVLFLLATDVVLKLLLKIFFELGVVDGGFRGVVDIVLNYFCGIAILIFCVVATVALACNGWTAVWKAIRSVRTG